MRRACQTTVPCCSLWEYEKEKFEPFRRISLLLSPTINPVDCRTPGIMLLSRRRRQHQLQSCPSDHYRILNQGQGSRFIAPPTPSRSIPKVSWQALGLWPRHPAFHQSQPAHNTDHWTRFSRLLPTIDSLHPPAR